MFVGFPVVLYRKSPLFPGICGEFVDGAVWGRGIFFLAFLAFGTFGTGEGLLWYGICARCAEQPLVVRGTFSKAFGVKNRLLRYGMTEWIFGAQNRLLWYATHFRALPQKQDIKHLKNYK